MFTHGAWQRSCFVTAAMTTTLGVLSNKGEHVTRFASGLETTRTLSLKGGLMSRLRIGIGILALAALLPAALASGQASTGNIYGRAVDEQGGALPGVSVTLTGPGAPLTSFTDARGEFRFLSLSVGSYSLTD